MNLENMFVLHREENRGCQIRQMVSTPPAGRRPPRTPQAGPAMAAARSPGPPASPEVGDVAANCHGLPRLFQPFRTF